MLLIYELKLVERWLHFNLFQRAISFVRSEQQMLHRSWALESHKIHRPSNNRVLLNNHRWIIEFFLVVRPSHKLACTHKCNHLDLHQWFSQDMLTLHRNRNNTNVSSVGSSIRSRYSNVGTWVSVGHRDTTKAALVTKRESRPNQSWGWKKLSRVMARIQVSWLTKQSVSLEAY